jgi:hypothetical protein
MTDLDTALNQLDAVVSQFMTATDNAGAAWTTPRAPGKWSPSQVVEHVARIMEESANVVAGVPSKFPTVPGVLRPITRAFVFRRALRKNAFPRLKTAQAFDPLDGPRTPAEGRLRVAGALARFERTCRARAAANVASTIFGAVSVADFTRFQALHVRNHLEQIPPAA